MKKPFDFRQVDTTRHCIDCNAPLKKNLLVKCPDADRCYVCDKLHSNTLNINRKKLVIRQKKQRQSYNA
jgi:hypothetical protein